jgi:hypothetical protein
MIFNEKKVLAANCSSEEALIEKKSLKAKFSDVLSENDSTSSIFG